MSQPPDRPKIYHITHVDNLAQVVRDGGLYSDVEMTGQGRTATTIGMSTIKKRRLCIPVNVHSGTHVADYVPFYFCPRSIMLFVLHKANHPELTFREGQGRIVHLEADCYDVIAWADAVGRSWAFSLSNAGSWYVQILTSVVDLRRIDWQAVASTDFRDPDVKEGKQAEFLLYKSFPWHLISRIGVMTEAVRRAAGDAIVEATHKPAVIVQPGWYY